MSMLKTLKSKFHKAFPRWASGQYVHFFVVRHSQSFPVFQTDGVLNTALTQAGLDSEAEESSQMIKRLVMFKRKQVAPERLVGRQLLRSLGFIGDIEDEDDFCGYNSQKTCKQCPDCILYGFGIGDKGAERSKVYSDSVFSLSDYDTSHKNMTFNALAETGTMSERIGDRVIIRSSINEQDHILPEVVFPSVETVRDATFEGFIYVLGNLLRTRRYGAQESRTGTMSNHIVGIAFCDAEVFSNLYFTQALYDALKSELNVPIKQICKVAAIVAQEQLDQEPVLQRGTFFDNALEELLTEVKQIYQDQIRLRSTIANLYQQTQTYAQTYGAITPKREKD